MSDVPGYGVTITRNGPASAPYGWHIREQAFGPVIKSSFMTFPTRIEALNDSARAAAELVRNGQAAPHEESPAVHNVARAGD
jgi:hypothetical protein